MSSIFTKTRLILKPPLKEPLSFLLKKNLKSHYQLGKRNKKNSPRIYFIKKNKFSLTSITLDYIYT